MKKNRFLSIFILCIVIFNFILLSSCALLKDEKLDTITTNMVNAFIAKNKEAVKALLHPSYTNSIDTLDFEAMEKTSGIILEGTLDNLTPTSRNYSVGTEGNTTSSEYIATIGDKKYIIVIKTLKNDTGFGIVMFNINNK